MDSMASVLNKSAMEANQGNHIMTDHDYMNMEVDDFDEKPVLSELNPEKPDKEVVELVIDAIRKSDNQKLTFEGICQSIQKTYLYYSMKSKRDKWHLGDAVKAKLCDGNMFYKVVGSGDDPMWALKGVKREDELNDPLTGGKFSKNDATGAEKEWDEGLPPYTVKDGVYSCSQCKVKLSSRQRIKRHIMSHVFGEKFKFRCEDCDFKTKIEKTFEAHKANWCHPVKCDSCAFKTKNKQVMENHVKSKHIPKEKKQYVCEHCPEPKSFTALRSLEEHVQSIHLGVKRFYCEEENCDYGTFRLNELKYHMQMHTGQKSYRCEVGLKLLKSDTAVTDRFAPLER